MKQRGFTLIEMMIAVIFALCVVMLGVDAVTGASNGNTISYGVNGMTEMRCIDGYKFVVSQQGVTRQVMDEFGKGVRCEVPRPGGF
jgi:prepilin-type N-terminal cleavage/methylation domain-containing protein